MRITEVTENYINSDGNILQNRVVQDFSSLRSGVYTKLQTR